MASSKTSKKPAAKPKVTRAKLEKAATLRSDGATWDAIRAATGTRLGSSAWFRAWEREGIDHIAAGQRKPAKPSEKE